MRKPWNLVVLLLLLLCFLLLIFLRRSKFNELAKTLKFGVIIIIIIIIIVIIIIIFSKKKVIQWIRSDGSSSIQTWIEAVNEKSYAI